jgi:NhaA family Na+:H+ antiporter
MPRNVQQVQQMLREFLRLETSGGLVLMGATVLALVCANLPGVSWAYNELLHLDFEARIGGLGLEKDFLHLVNDGLMAVFFLLVGLELKREFLAGHLSDRRTVVLPIFAAIGGVALPALIYTLVAGADPVGSKGWAIPAATDIAFSLGVLSLLGSRVPLSLKVFLTTIAIVDDLAAIVIIALFYTEKLSLLALLLGLVGVGVLIILNRAGVTRPMAYLFVGALIWFCVLESGVHATLAGVAVAMTIPLTTKDPDYSPLRYLEHALHPWVAFMIIPVFAFANAGIAFGNVSPELITGPVSLGIAAGLLIGKTVGVFGFSALATRFGARLPEGVSWVSLLGVSLLTGIGFTMSLFIGTLAFERAGVDYAIATRLGVLSGSLIAGALGYLVLRRSLPKQVVPAD